MPNNSDSFSCRFWFQLFIFGLKVLVKEVCFDDIYLDTSPTFYFYCYDSIGKTPPKNKPSEGFNEKHGYLCGDTIHWTWLMNHWHVCIIKLRATILCCVNSVDAPWQLKLKDYLRQYFNQNTMYELLTWFSY